MRNSPRAERANTTASPTTSSTAAAAAALAKTNMYVMRAEAYIDELGDRPCPGCGAQHLWTLGYPANSKTGFVRF